MLFVAVVIPGLVGGARSSSKLSLKTGASLQNNPNKAPLSSTGPSPGPPSGPLSSNLGSGVEVGCSFTVERGVLLVKRSGVAVREELNVVKEL